MKTVSQTGTVTQSRVALESLEQRQLLNALPWAYWLAYQGFDKVFQDYPWLNGGGNNVAVIDKGIDYWHPALGGNQSKGLKSPRIVNVWDYRDNNNDPFPKESELTDPSSAHGTGVAGILAGVDGNYNGRHFKGILQNSLIYNLRTDRFHSQQTIKEALDWVLANYQKDHITAINLTEFIGTNAQVPVYNTEVQALYNAGVFIATPVANDWQDPVHPHYPIGYPAKSPYIFGTGGILRDGTMNPKTQRGPGLDILSASEQVNIPWYIPSTHSHIFVDYGTGNSWGTPHVVGTAVLMQQIDPTIKPAEIMHIMQASGVPVSDPDKTGNYVRLDAYAAIKMTYRVRDDIFGQTGTGNHTMQNAAALRIVRGGGAVANMKFLIGAPDWYSITLGAAVNEHIYLGYQSPGQQLGAALYNSHGHLVGSLGQYGMVSMPGPGTYYLKVSAPHSLDGTYSVSVKPQV